MKDFEGFEGSRTVSGLSERVHCCSPRALSNKMRARVKDVRCGHRAQVLNKAFERSVGNGDAIDVDHGANEAGMFEQGREGRSFDAWMDVGRRCAGQRVCSAHCSAQLWKGVSAGHCADEQRIVAHGMPDQANGERQIVDAVERTNSNHQVVHVLLRLPVILDDRFAVGALGKQAARIDDIDQARQGLHAVGRGRAYRPNDQAMLEPSAAKTNPLQAIFKRPLIKKMFGADACRAITAKGSKARVEQLRHAYRLCAEELRATRKVGCSDVR